MKKITYFVFACFILLNAPMFAQDNVENTTKKQQKSTKKKRKPISYENAPYRNDWKESNEDFQKRMQWWKEAEYGMFIHFGLYSQLGGEWKGEAVPKYAEWIMSTAKISKEEYQKLITSFNPKKFNADKIVEIAKNSGMKYLVITTKHHEGFCLWDSKYTEFDVASTPYKKDIIKQLKTACDKYGIKFGTYYSIIDWHHPSQELPKGKGYNQIPFAEPKAQNKKEYVTYMKNQIKELIENYDSDIMWFDGDWVNWWTLEDGLDLYAYIRKLKPEIIINNRVAKRKEFEFDFGTPEQFKIDSKVAYEWEACYTLNHSWGFKKLDHSWKQPQEVIDMKQQINSIGGNFLLNIGPDGEGNVPQESVDILLEVGKQLKKQ